MTSSYHRYLLPILFLISSAVSLSTSLRLSSTHHRNFQQHRRHHESSRYNNLASTNAESSSISRRTLRARLYSGGELNQEASNDDIVDAKFRGGKVSAQPTLRELAKFALPCLCLWISGPLLSLVDTASVGRTAKLGEGASELGALGPATTFIDGSTYLFAFLNVATTNLYASALAKNGEGKGNESARKASDAVVRTAVKISLFCGLGIFALLMSQSGNLLSLYIGSSAPSEILRKSQEYVKIRAFSMPTSLLGGVLQAALLGAKDSVTPLIAVLVSTIVNILGDGICVFGLNMGTKGAGLATLLAQWAGTIALWGPAKNKLLVTSTADERKEHKVSSKDFLSFAAPVLTLILGKIAAFGVMTHVAAALPGYATLASHQIILSLFFFVSPFLEVISQTAQAFLPQFYVGDAKDSNGNMIEAQILAKRLLRIGVVVGGLIAILASSIPKFAPNFLTNDLVVQEAVKPLALPLFLGSLLTAPVAVSEGILLARRELKFLASVYIASTAIFPFALFKIKKTGAPVTHVWFGFAIFQLFRATCFTSRLWGAQILKKVASKFRSGASSTAIST